MRVIAKEACFVGGSRRRPGQEFDYTGDPKRLSKACVPLGGKTAAPHKEEEKKHDAKVPTKAEIKVQLAQAGVEFDSTLNHAGLMALLEETIKKIAPASSGAPDKSLETHEE